MSVAAVVITRNETVVRISLVVIFSTSKAYHPALPRSNPAVAYHKRARLMNQWAHWPLSTSAPALSGPTRRNFRRRLRCRTSHFSGRPKSNLTNGIVAFIAFYLAVQSANRRADQQEHFGMNPRGQGCAPAATLF